MYNEQERHGQQQHARRRRRRQAEEVETNRLNDAAVNEQLDRVANNVDTDNKQCDLM